MIQIFVTDIDGCLTKPFESPNWDLITQIRDLNRQSRNDEDVPQLTICSGRPLPYVEAVAQWLDIDLPVIFENAGLYWPKENRMSINHFDDEASREASELKKWLFEEILDQYPDALFEFSKKTDIGFIHPDKQVIDELYPVVEEYVEESSTLFEVHATDISINIILSTNNKKEGLLSLAEEQGVSHADIAFIGDASGDVEALEIAGYPFAPTNAVPAVKQVATVLEESYTNAVLEAYYRLVEINLGLSRKRKKPTSY